MLEERDRLFFRNYSIVLGILAVMIVIFLILARHFGVDEAHYIEQRAEKISQTTKPEGEVRVEGEEQPAATTAVAAAGTTADAGGTPGAAGDAAAPADPGKQVYSGLCFSCHGTGLPGIPQLGDKAAWAPRVEQGAALLYERAINGFTGKSGIMMPARGGNPALTDEQVKAAVDYMVANSK